MKAFGFDVDALTKSITHPFVNILEQFNTQMNQLHAEVKTTNKLLKEITEQNHSSGCLLERELRYINTALVEIKKTMTEGKDEEV